MYFVLIKCQENTSQWYFKDQTFDLKNYKCNRKDIKINKNVRL